MITSPDFTDDQVRDIARWLYPSAWKDSHKIKFRKGRAKRRELRLRALRVINHYFARGSIAMSSMRRKP